MSKSLPSHFTFRPVIADQHTAARAYFLCVVGMLLMECLTWLPGYLFTMRKPKNPLPQRPRNRWTLRVWLHKLLTHPSPVPLLTDHNVATIARCLLFTALNILFAWTRIRYTTDYQRFGWLTLANAGLALLLPTRTNLFSLVTRIPRPVLLSYHRWAGVATLIHATLHFSLTAQQYAATAQLSTVLQNLRIQIGLTAYAALSLLFLTSLRPLRRRLFELFYFSHFPLFLLFLAGALYHASHAVEFLVPGLCLWAADLGLRFLLLSRDVSVHSVTHHPGDLVKIQFRASSSPFLARGSTMAPGRMAWVHIPGASRVQWHPFTLMTAAGGNERGSEGSSSNSMIAIRGQGSGGWAKKAVAQTGGGGGQELRVRIDGPYGGAADRHIWTRYPVVVLVAGGIGITPAIDVAGYILREAATRGKSGGSGGRQNQRVYLLWSVKERAHAAWFEDELTALAGLAGRADVGVEFEVVLHVTGGGSGKGLNEGVVGDAVKWDGPGVVRRGRPDVGEWFRGIKAAEPAGDAVVSVCGPKPLKDDVRRAAASVSTKEGLMFVEEEVFEF